MIPSNSLGPWSFSRISGLSIGGSGTGVSALSCSSVTVIGPIFFHVSPLSVLRSIQAAHVLYASTDDPLTIVPSASTSGFARIGPSNPAGNRSGFDHVLPSSVLHIRAPDQLPVSGPAL